MKLAKEGVVVETIRPNEILRYKRKGYVEVAPEPEVDAGETALDVMNMEQLREVAKERGLKGYSTMNKDALLALLKEDQDSGEEE